MPEQPAIPEPHPASSTQAGAQLHAIIEQLTDEEATAIWRLVCLWVAEGITKQPAQGESEEHP